MNTEIIAFLIVAFVIWSTGDLTKKAWEQEAIDEDERL